MVGGKRLLFHVRITPKASSNRIMGWEEDVDHRQVLKVRVTSAPERGKANEALIDLLSKEWSIPKSRISLEKGEADRNKVLSIPEDFKSALKMA